MLLFLSGFACCLEFGTPGFWPLSCKAMGLKLRTLHRWCVVSIRAYRGESHLAMKYDVLSEKCRLTAIGELGDG